MKNEFLTKQHPSSQLCFLCTFIEEIYAKRFKKDKPDRVISIEEQAQELRRKQAEKKERKRLKRAAENRPSGETED